jgi:hypothetical protein
MGMVLILSDIWRLPNFLCPSDFAARGGWGDKRLKKCQYDHWPNGYNVLLQTEWPWKKYQLVAYFQNISDHLSM